MEEFMKLYEKQKRLDDETKLKMTTMQERNSKLKLEIEELKKTENELLKDHLEYWKNIKELHLIGVEYPLRTKETNLTSQSVAKIAENATKNADAANALLSELEHTSNANSSPQVVNKVQCLRITRGGKKVPPNYCFQFNDTGGYCSYQGCTFKHIIYDADAKNGSVPNSPQNNHSQLSNGSDTVARDSGTSRASQDNSPAGHVRKPIDAEAEWDRRNDSTSDSFVSTRSGPRPISHVPGTVNSGNGNGNGNSNGKERPARSRSRSRSRDRRVRRRSRSRSDSRSDSRSRSRGYSFGGGYSEPYGLDRTRDNRIQDDRDRYLRGDQERYWMFH